MDGDISTSSPRDSSRMSISSSPPVGPPGSTSSAKFFRCHTFRCEVPHFPRLAGAPTFANHSERCTPSRDAWPSHGECISGGRKSAAAPPVSGPLADRRHQSMSFPLLVAHSYLPVPPTATVSAAAYLHCTAPIAHDTAATSSTTKPSDIVEEQHRLVTMLPNQTAPRKPRSSQQWSAAENTTLLDFMRAKGGVVQVDPRLTQG